MDRNVFTELCLEQLKQSGVHDGEKVVVLSQGDERLDYADAFLAAGQRLGARMYHLRLPAPLPGDGSWAVGQTGLAGNPEAVEALKKADMVVDLIFLLFSPEQMAIQAAGARVLTAVEPAPLLARLMPTKQLRERVEVGVDYMKKAKSLRITSKAGTDVVYKMGVYPTVGEYGSTDEAGRWDHWPAAFVFSGAADDGVDGQIVLAPGDVLLPLNIYVREPVIYTIEKGFIQDIRGGLEADLIKSYMKTFNDPRGMGMSHVGWGLDHRANWHGLCDFGGGMGMELRSFYGNVMFSTGPNNELGGPNDTACHLDIPMRNCSLFLDDEPMVLDGDIAVKEMQHNWK
ncbi:leucyl aminopeptidase [Rhizobium mongolense]|uniref:leucyl aminopeptidase n=1 Tax=Rhizobium TaxID=379 RepID=UPI001EF94B47|nr:MULTISPECIES: leucyl aminopeptidase [Rhizobium]ULJ75643.1 leucyl aminopeptidase [Rhizobium gallicum]WFU90960.1 leucyl aminopeptidase [Rhizobium sp. CC1099]